VITKHILACLNLSLVCRPYARAALGLLRRRGRATDDLSPPLPLHLQLCYRLFRLRIKPCISESDAKDRQPDMTARWVGCA
jgi:hypothetical protein